MSQVPYSVLACSHPSDFFPLTKIIGQEAYQHATQSNQAMQANNKIAMPPPSLQVGDGWQTDGRTNRCDILLEIGGGYPQAVSFAALEVETASATHCSLFELTKYRPNTSHADPPSLDAALSAVMDFTSGQSATSARTVLPRTELLSVYEHKEVFSQLASAKLADAALGEETDNPNSIAAAAAPPTTSVVTDKLSTKAKVLAINFPVPFAFGAIGFSYFILRLSCSWEPGHPLGMNSLKFLSSPSQPKPTQNLAQPHSASSPTPLLSQNGLTQQQLAAAIFAAAEDGFKRARLFQKELETLVGTGASGLLSPEGAQLLDQFTVSSSTVGQAPFLLSSTPNPYAAYNDLSGHVAHDTTNKVYTPSTHTTLAAASMSPAVNDHPAHKNSAIQATPTYNVNGGNTLAPNSVPINPYSTYVPASYGQTKTSVASSVVGPSPPAAALDDDHTDVESDSDMPSTGVPRKGPAAPPKDDHTDVEDEDDNINISPPSGAVAAATPIAPVVPGGNPYVNIVPQRGQATPPPKAAPAPQPQNNVYNPLLHQQQQPQVGASNPYFTTPPLNNPAVNPYAAIAASPTGIYNPHTHSVPPTTPPPVQVYNPHTYAPHSVAAPNSPATTVAAAPATVYNPHAQAPHAAQAPTATGKPLAGVVFILSGYVNPQRSKLRDDAVALGAVCKNDWDPATCTHLVTVGSNTPKYNQVVMHAVRPHTVYIVNEQWIATASATKTRPAESGFQVGLGVLPAAV